MDYQEHYESTKAAFNDALAGVKQQPVMMRIDPFDAEDEDGEQIRIIGVYDDHNEMRFIAIHEQENGEIYPSPISPIYKKGTAANTHND